MLSDIKIKIDGLDNKDIQWKPVNGLPFSSEVWSGLTAEERAVLGFLKPEYNAVKTKININDVPTTIYATPGSKLTVVSLPENVQVNPVPTSPQVRGGQIFNEEEPVLYLVYSDLTVGFVEGRNILGWTKLRADIIRRASVIISPVAIGPETYATEPLSIMKVSIINESHITDSTILKMDVIIASDIANSRIEGSGEINNVIADDLNCSAKTINLKNAFLSSCSFHGKSLTINFPGGKSCGLFNRTFFSKNADIVISSITDIFGINLNVCDFTFIKVDPLDHTSSEFYMGTSNHDKSTKTPIIDIGDPVDPKHNPQDKFAILIKGELGEAGIDVEDDTYESSIDSLVTSVINTVQSRQRFNLMILKQAAKEA